MAIMPLRLEEKDKDRCTLCTETADRCICALVPDDKDWPPPPLDKLKLVDRLPTQTVTEKNNGYPICPNCQDSVEYCIY